MALKQLAEKFPRIYSQRLGVLDEFERIEHLRSKFDRGDEVAIAFQTRAQLLLCESRLEPRFAQNQS